MDLFESKISFIGAGNMATAIMSGLIKKGVPAANILASEPDSEKLNTLQTTLGIQITTDNLLAAAEADVLILSVKPQILQKVSEPLSEILDSRACMTISIAAGIEMKSLENWLGSKQAIVRCMPNTPAQISEGASGLFANPQVTAAQRTLAESIFVAVGSAQWVTDETLMHAVTALSGSGPAYAFLMIASMAEAGVKQGLSEETAKALAAQTVLGAAKMVLESEFSPQKLKKNVMSPGGTTERAISILEGENTEGSLPELCDKAIAAATARSQELAGLLGN